MMIHSTCTFYLLFTFAAKLMHSNLENIKENEIQIWFFNENKVEWNQMQLVRYSLTENINSISSFKWIFDDIIFTFSFNPSESALEF